MKPTMHLTPADYLVVIGYFTLILGVGLWVKRSQTTATDFFAGGHQIPWWMAGISHYMSTFSAFSFIVYSQMAYTYGWVAITIFWTGVPACILGGALFAKRWRRTRVITPIEFLEQRCNANIRQLYVWVGIPSKLFDCGLKIFATALFLSVTVGLGLNLSILLCGGIVIAYTLSGGLFALVVADYVQFLMKSLAILLLLPLAISRAGPIRSAFSGIPSPMFHLTAHPYGAVYVIGYAVVVILSYNGNWALAQKYYSVPNEHAASKAAYLSAALTFVGSPIMFLPAILARKFMPDLIAQGRTSDVYVLLLLELLPVGMIGIIVAAMFSATMAAVSSDLNAIASVLTKDWYQRRLNRAAKETTLLRVGRIFTAVLGSAIMAMSLWLAHSHYQSIFQLMVTVLGVLVVPTLLPVLCLLIWRSLSAAGVICGLLSGLLTGICMVAIDQLFLHPRHLPEGALLMWQGCSILLNTVMTVVGMYAGSKLWPAAGSEKERTEQFFIMMEKPVQASEIAPNAQVSHPGKIIGFTTCVIGLLLVAAGAISGLRIARTLDFSCGAILLVIGLASAFGRRTANKEENIGSTAR
jgi:solute:Na+ symporter, SSS family